LDPSRYDTDGSISNLMEMERENPEAMLEPADLEEVQSGAAQIRCDVCHAAAKVAYNRAVKRKLLRDEEAISHLVHNEVCYGTPADRTDDEYPKYPGNPPLWGEQYTVSKQSGGGGAAGDDAAGAERVWAMRRLAKGAQVEEKGGKEYSELVVKHAMISRACKQVVLEYDEYVDDGDGESADLAQSIYEFASGSAPSGAGAARRLAQGYCRPFCAGGGTAAAERKDEL